ncbi:MAG: hypothetical protein IKA46_03330 [Clostridia bacterium]|nr:hypothetical protein [Clostridia bacterium]
MEYRDEKNTCIQSQVTDKIVSFEQSGELSLPDYLGEVSRLLWVRPTILPPARFLNGANAEFTGRICYDALYASTDGALYHANMGDTYSFSVPTTAGRADMLCATVYPDVMVGRVAAPRKLSLRCRLHAHVCGYDEKSISTVLPPEVRDSACCLGDMAECGKLYSAVGDAVEIYDEIDVGGVGELRVISSRAEIFLPEVSAHTGFVRCRGEAVVTLLCCREAECEEGADQGGLAPYVTVRRLPLSFEVPLEDVTADFEARGCAVAEEVRAVQDQGKISLAVRVIPQVEAQCNEAVYYTKDLFVPSSRTECRCTEEKIWVPQICGNKNYSISNTFSASEMGMPAGAEVIDAIAEAEVKDKSTDEKNIFMAGEIHCHVLYRQGAEYGVSDVTLPFRVSCEGSFEAISVLATVPVLHVQREREQIRVDAELMLSMRGACFATVKPVCEAKLSPCEKRSFADLELCYPGVGESLWEVSRRYAVSPADIAVANGIGMDDMDSDKSLDAVRYLMIPTNKP